ncbi:response regulator [Mesorhizobium sp. B2-4-12]|uniref:response regulator n=1 Tax=unclassified Mesorhizobium TaxID=325217 RepID=UPI00112722EC|nr:MULTISPECIES: response regulator [unclassified Mesorhizobium]TPK76106.1 response regulator [Mesorhizobium sp. B2-4-17]TPK98703.1 response regulator [Mesorhizobium sp. B2-4-12]UCI29746.1 response regulator [Mesorhizobium sp. B4-1-4]
MQFLIGAKVLIVEDEFVVADDLARYFSGLGATILGPAQSVVQARPYAEQADAAVLDIDLNGTPVFPIADRLVERGVPFVFFSAHDRNVIPSRLEHAANLLKSADRRKIIAALFPAGTRQDQIDEPADVLSLLPKLRLAARLMLGDASAADRLVETTLELAIREVGDRPADISTERWLNYLLQISADKAADLLN